MKSVNGHVSVVASKSVRACEHLMCARARALVSTLAPATVRVPVNTSVKRVGSRAESTLMKAPASACLSAPVSTLGSRA